MSSIPSAFFTSDLPPVQFTTFSNLSHFLTQNNTSILIELELISLHSLRINYHTKQAERAGCTKNMHCTLTFAAALGAVGFLQSSIVGAHSTDSHAAGSAAKQINAGQVARTPYRLVREYAGSDFFNGWTFWGNEPDPTHGFVQYQTAQGAKDAGLVGFIQDQRTNETTAYLAVDSKNVAAAPGRKAVRISSEEMWHTGLFVADVRHHPGGSCGSWPALWLVGEDWPNGGEIDIIEGVHDTDYNSVVLHTGPGCSTSAPQTTYSGKLTNPLCTVDPNGGENTGCPVQAPRSQIFRGSAKQTMKHATTGPSFNRGGGGIYVTEWNEDSISVWMFPRHMVPADITAGHPNPRSWKTKPMARFAGPGCDYRTKFTRQQLVINHTFCGDWAGKVWNDTPSCAARAPTCEDFVSRNPQAFKDAWWEIASIRVYQDSQTVAGAGAALRAAVKGR